LLALAGTTILFVMTNDSQSIEKSIVLYVMSFSYLASAALLVFSKTVAGYFTDQSTRTSS
jgi:hypothetical protein